MGVPRSQGLEEWVDHHHPTEHLLLALVLCPPVSGPGGRSITRRLVLGLESHACPRLVWAA